MVIERTILTKNIAYACAKYAGACGKKNILLTKPIKNVNITELGVYLSDDALHFLNGKIIIIKSLKNLIMREKYKVNLL